MSTRPEVWIRDLASDAAPLIAELVEDGAASRLFARDATLWGAEAEAEASIRLGWVDAAERAGELLDEITALRDAFAAQGIERIVLCGMGGSSLAPEVIARRDGVPLVILDSTHPVTVARVVDVDPAHTAVVVSSKSGSTIETRSHLARFEQRLQEAGVDAASRIVIVTDPGSPLEAHAVERGYRVFRADPHVGGRFSALTAFGLVPAGLAGADIRALVAEAAGAAAALREDVPENPAIRLAAGIAAGLPERFACALSDADRIGLGDWIEQLLAESTGKHGHGVLPVAIPEDAPEVAGNLPATAELIALTSKPLGGAADEAHALTVSAPLGAQLLLWETATALLCRLMLVNPFDQPDVESAKAAARSALTGEQRDVTLARLDDPTAGGIQVLSSPASEVSELPQALRALREAHGGHGYLAIQAYLDGLPIGEQLMRLRNAFVTRWGVPTTLGWGPRFLHSTGQLHKGGPAIGAYLQLLDSPARDVPIPGEEAGFSQLIAAQALGDREVLMDRGRPVLALRAADAAKLLEALETALQNS